MWVRVTAAAYFYIIFIFSLVLETYDMCNLGQGIKIEGWAQLAS